MSEEYIFSTELPENFSNNITKLFEKEKDNPISCLEIGVFEGRSGCWMLDNILTHKDSSYSGIELKPLNIAYKNFNKHEPKVTLYEGSSRVVCSQLRKQFDIVYIDGSKIPFQVLEDSVLCWALTKKYLIWNNYRVKAIQNVVNTFIQFIKADLYKIVLSSNQFGIEKIEQPNKKKSDDE